MRIDPITQRTDRRSCSGGARAVAAALLMQQPTLVRYDPDRWIKADKADPTQGEALFSTAGAEAGVNDFSYPTFNAGPRLCIGRPLAYLEMQLMLAVLLPRYEFSLANDRDDSYVQTLVPPKKTGLIVRATALSTAASSASPKRPAPAGVMRL